MSRFVPPAQRSGQRTTYRLEPEQLKLSVRVMRLESLPKPMDKYRGKALIGLLQVTEEEES